MCSGIRDSRGIYRLGGKELISSHFQWMELVTSGCKWVLASFILDEIKVIKNLLSIIYFRLMKMNNFGYKTPSCASKFSLALQAVQWNISGWC